MGRENVASEMLAIIDSYGNKIRSEVFERPIPIPEPKPIVEEDE